MYNTYSRGSPELQSFAKNSSREPPKKEGKLGDLICSIAPHDFSF